jgi:uncharacterized membrane protein YphA (DoxX/SURF4 family)/thiol-disulfide isomerase/thioredoxin
MASLALVARLLLAVVFAVAAVGKLRDREGSRQALADFGAPAVPVRLAILLPLAELAVAAALIPTGSARWGAIGALVLLAVFPVAIAVNLGRGNTPDCNCFGSIGSAPVGPATLARNVVLLAPAVYLVARSDSGPSTVGWLGEMGGGELAAFIAAALAIALAGVALSVAWVVLRSHGRLLLRIDELQTVLDATGIGGPEPPHVGLPLGGPAPEFALAPLDGGPPVTLRGLLAGEKPVLLVASSAGCGPCGELMPEVARWQSDYADRLTVAVLASGDEDAIRAEMQEHGTHGVLLDPDATVAAALECFGTPAAVLVDREGDIASGVAGGGDAIEKLVARSLHDTGAAVEQGLPVGEAPPPLELAGLDGPKVALADLRGAERLLVFWNPGCGFCDEMLDDLRARAAEPEPGAPELLIISSGGTEETRANGFECTVALDPEMSAGEAFGAAGTPMAVLLDAEGRVASPLAAGGDEVLRLARGQTSGFEVVQVPGARNGAPPPG